MIKQSRYFIYFTFAFIAGCDKPAALPTYDSSAKKIIISVQEGEKIMLPDGGVYQGEYKDGLFHGTGTMVWANGAQYTGKFKYGLFNGQGKSYEANGTYYEGEYLNGMAEGKGYLKFINGDEYRGEFAKSNFHGKGVFKSHNGNVFAGDFLKGEMTGKGKITYKDSGSYEGEVKNWQMHGNGVYQLKNQEFKYIGEFKHDVMSGQGEIVSKDGSHYTGQIDNWVANGVGELFKSNGEHYQGEFKHGYYHGKGVVVYKNKNSYDGNFENGVRHGKGRYIRANPKGRKKELVGWWRYDEFVGEKPPAADGRERNKRFKVDAEKIFYSQAQLLQQNLAQLKPSNPAVPDLYMINFASYGGQDVFMKEAQYVQNLFDKNFGTMGRSLTLINNHKLNDKIPLASVTNLQTSLQHVAGLMGQEDILFLFLTSHGSDKHELSVSLRGLPLNDLPARTLASLLKQSGIKWKVVVVSACYSGGFINELKDDHTMVLTAAKADHVSFGCDDEADFTFFGRAFFKTALSESDSFKQAFEKARGYVSQWEDKEKYSHSEPQIWSTSKIEEQLRRWRATLNQTLAAQTEQIRQNK